MACSLYNACQESPYPHIYYTNDPRAPEKWCCNVDEGEKRGIEYIKYHKSILFTHYRPPFDYVSIGDTRKVLTGDKILVIEETGAYGVETWTDQHSLFKDHDVMDYIDESSVRRLPDSARMDLLNGRSYIRITPLLTIWAIAVFERMKKLTIPRWISRYKEISESTSHKLFANVLKRRQMYEKMKKLKTILRILDEEDEENEREDAYKIVEEMAGGGWWWRAAGA